MGLFDFFKKNNAPKKTEENLSPEQVKNKFINDQTGIALKGLSGLTEDDIYYVNYLLGLKFYEDAVEYVFKFKNERNAEPDTDALEALNKLKPIYDAIMDERNRPIQQLTNEELGALAKQFLDKYEVKAELITDEIILKEDPKTPVWVLPAILLPPSSLTKRNVEILISAKTHDVIELK